MNIVSRNTNIKVRNKKSKSKKTRVIVVPKWLTQYIRIITLVFMAIFVLTFLGVGFIGPLAAFIFLVMADATNNWPLWNLLIVIFLSIFWYSAFYLITKNKGILDW